MMPRNGQSLAGARAGVRRPHVDGRAVPGGGLGGAAARGRSRRQLRADRLAHRHLHAARHVLRAARRDRKSTRLNSSHLGISYAVFCLKKKKNRFKKHFSENKNKETIN